MRKLKVYTIREVIEVQLRPNNKPLIYILSINKNIEKGNVLYVGQSGVGNIFRPKVRIGSLIISVLGFFNEQENKKHTAAEKVYLFCKKNDINPLDLYIAWMYTKQAKEIEKQFIKKYNPKFNKK